MTRGEKRELKWGIIFVSPWIIGLALFYFYPMFTSLYYSFTRYTIIRPPRWVGLLNYRWLLTDNVFWTSVGNTLYFMIIGVPLTQITALIVAYMFYYVRKSKILSSLKVFYLFPVLVPGVILAIVWNLMLNSQYGVFNFFLHLFGINGPNWLESPYWSKPSIVLVGLWYIGMSMIIYIAALNDVPKELYEVADLDGAKWWTKLSKITIPMISPAVLFNVITGMISIIQLFDLPYILTNGGPNYSSYTWAMQIYDNAFTYMNMGYASASAWLLFLITFGLTVLIFIFSKKKIYYRGEG